MVPTGSRRGESERGFSLAEVVVALGVLASVLISVAGLLVLGNRLVKSGRGSSLGLAVARDVLEELDGWSFARTYEAFDCDGIQPTCTVDIDHAEMARWKQALAEDVFEGSAEILIETIDGGLPLADSHALRITVVVSWSEGERRRRASLTTVRM